ncbi:MAG: hypothetical protein ACT4P5_20775 [Armatimonadota bacterium]
MAKAEINLSSGGKVTVEGTPEEIQALLQLYSSAAGADHDRSRRVARTAEPSSEGYAGPRSYIRELKKEGFFKTKQSLKFVESKLAERGFIYSSSTVAAALLNLTKKKELGRIKEDGIWLYVNR